MRAFKHGLHGFPPPHRTLRTLQPSQACLVREALEGFVASLRIIASGIYAFEMEDLRSLETIAPSNIAVTERTAGLRTDWTCLGFCMEVTMASFPPLNTPLPSGPTPHPMPFPDSCGAWAVMQLLSMWLAVQGLAS